MRTYNRLQVRETDVDNVGSVMVVRFVDEQIVDLLEIEEMGQELCGLVQEASSGRFLLNFSGVKFFSSAGIGKLISFHGKVRSRKGSMKLCRLPVEIFDVFKACNLDSLFDIRQDEADALRSFGLPALED